MDQEDKTDSDRLPSDHKSSPEDCVMTIIIPSKRTIHKLTISILNQAELPELWKEPIIPIYKKRQ
jgi:hypothetical protein